MSAIATEQTDRSELAEVEAALRSGNKNLKRLERQIADEEAALRGVDANRRAQTAAALDQLYPEQTRLRGIAADAKVGYDTAFAAHQGERRAHHRQMVESKVRAFATALGPAIAANRELQQAWHAAKEDAVEMDVLFWPELLDANGSRCSDWRDYATKFGLLTK